MSLKCTSPKTTLLYKEKLGFAGVYLFLLFLFLIQKYIGKAVLMYVPMKFSMFSSE